eukprot:397639-Pelagomonas_calceolata.AAC.1
MCPMQTPPGQLWAAAWESGGSYGTAFPLALFHRTLRAALSASSKMCPMQTPPGHLWAAAWEGG